MVNIYFIYILYLASKSSQTSNTLVIAAINADEFYPHPPPNALLRRADPAKPAMNPSAPLSIVGLPVKILLFVFFLLFLQGLKKLFNKVCVPAPMAAPASPAVPAWLSPKNLF